jgi:hypothetical protein
LRCACSSRNSFPSDTRQSLTTVSPEKATPPPPEASNLPSGENATLMTGLVWARKTC